MINLSTEETQSLQKVLEYVLSSEEKNYEAYIKEGGTPEKHIYYHANMLKYIVELKSDLPDVKLSGTPDKFFKKD